MKNIFPMQLNSTTVPIGLRETWKILTSESLWGLLLHLYCILSYARYLIIDIMTVEKHFLCVFFSQHPDINLTYCPVLRNQFCGKCSSSLTPSKLKEHDHKTSRFRLVINMNAIYFGSTE